MAVPLRRAPDLFRDSAADLVAAFDRIRTTQEFIDYFQACIESAGFSHFLIGGVPSGREPIEKMILMHNYPADWVSKYISLNYFEVDPVAQYCRQTTEPFFWEEASEKFRTSLEFDRFMGESREAGLKWGVCVPIHNINECEACISLAASEQCISDSDLPIIQLFCIYAFQKAKSLKRFDLLEAPKLTRREREILVCAAAGRTAAETGAILQVSEATVNFHLHRAMQKLGARNKVEAVARSILQRFNDGESSD